jgi:hypothetical protein
MRRINGPLQRREARVTGKRSAFLDAPETDAAARFVHRREDMAQVDDIGTESHT